jgi:hypothetical protein
MNMLNYLIQNKLKNLVEVADEFWKVKWLC